MHPNIKIILKYLAPILLVVAVYALVNGVAYGVQKYVHRGDEQRLHTLTAEINIQEAALSTLDKRIGDEESRIKALDTKITAEQPTADPTAYNADVAAYNQLVGTYKADVQSYNQQLPAYNAKVTEANGLAKKVGSSWYIVPLPTTRH